MFAKTTTLPTFEDIKQIALTSYTENFGSQPELACCSPGRVNLIGDHVDYVDGFVLPMALPMVTLLVGSQRTDKDVDIVTCCAGADAPKRTKFSLDANLKPGKPKWANYIKGVIHSYGQLKQGFNAVVVSNVPMGSGLSSSAALEMATLTFLEQLQGISVESNAKRALICQKAEHDFVGMPCGIMDQMVSVSGQIDHVLLLDCRSLETFQIPFDARSQDLAVLICNSDVRHELSSSEYPTRRKQCAQALELMSLNSYRDAKEKHLSALQSGVDEVLLKRARHVITEIQRTQEAAAALRERNFKKMGKLMTDSHASLRDDFEVSCAELDALVDAAINCSGALGSRMTGGGFGGCTVTLLQRAAVDNVISEMRQSFMKKFNKSAAENLEFYVCTPSGGARRIEL